MFGRKAYPTLTAVKNQVDLVMIVVAPCFVFQAVEDSIRMGAKGILIITAGLGENGEEGKRIEERIMMEAAKVGSYVIGPNCSGMFSASASIHLLGVPGFEIKSTEPDKVIVKKVVPELRACQSFRSR